MNGSVTDKMQGAIRPISSISSAHTHTPLLLNSQPGQVQGQHSEWWVKACIITRYENKQRDGWYG